VSSFTTTTADFTQPAISGTVNVTVLNSTWIAVGEPMLMATGGSYLVTAVPDTTHVTLQNLGYAGNETVGNNITAGKLLTPSGFKGDTGAAGPAGASLVEVYDTDDTPAATQDITLTKPAGKTWSTFEITYVGSFTDAGVGSVSVDFEWQTAPIAGSALVPSNAVGCGNGGQSFGANNSDDAISPTWLFKGTVPVLLASTNAITLRATITLASMTQTSGVFAGKGVYLA
jgi:hypothetical protein